MESISAKARQEDCSGTIGSSVMVEAPAAQIHIWSKNASMVKLHHPFGPATTPSQGVGWASSFWRSSSEVCGQRVGEAQKRVFGVDLLQQFV